MSETRELARRAIACPGWHIMLRMSDTEGRQVVHLLEQDAWLPYHDGILGPWQPTSAFMPDLSDPATLGCLLALVREAWGSGEVWQPGAPNDQDTWRCRVVVPLGWRQGFKCFDGATEAEALVAALEGAAHG